MHTPLDREQLARWCRDEPTSIAIDGGTAARIVEEMTREIAELHEANRRLGAVAWENERAAAVMSDALSAARGTR